MVEFDIVAQFSAIPVDMRRGPVLIEVMIAQSRIDGKVDAIRSDSFLVAMAELHELRAFVRHRHLAAAVIRHVSADDEATRPGDPLAGAVKAARPAGDRLRPAPLLEPVQRGDMAKQIGVGLAFRRAIGTEPARHPAGVDVARKQESDIERAGLCPGPGEGAPAWKSRRGGQAGNHIAPGNIRALNHLPTSLAPFNSQSLQR